MENNKTHAKRAGSGRKPKYSEPTKIISIRVPESKSAHYRKMLTSFVEASEKNNVTE